MTKTLQQKIDAIVNAVWHTDLHNQQWQINLDKAIQELRAEIKHQMEYRDYGCEHCNGKMVAYRDVLALIGEKK